MPSHEVQAEYLLDVRRAALQSVLNSVTFSRNPRLGKLLEYLCCQTLAGESAALKEYTIATDVFGRHTDFDQSTDAIVRVEMHRLRKKLKEFYAGEGRNQEIEISIQSGHYAPEFLERKLEASEPKAASIMSTPVPAVSSPVARGRSWMYIAVFLGLIAVIIWLTLLPRMKTTGSSTVPAPSSPAVTGLPAVPGSGITRILCGRLHSSFRDREGNEWGPDAFFEGGTAIELPVQPIYRTRNPSVFLGMRSGDFFYKIPLRPGVYELHLDFVDTSFSPSISMQGGENNRMFQVDLNGKGILHDFDIIATAGANTACEQVFKDVHPGKDGYLHLRFVRAFSEPVLSAIELLPGTPHRIRPIRIATQDSGFTDKDGVYWAPDNYFLNGRPIAKYGIVTGTADAQIFGRERYGNFSYALPAAPGKYELALYFSETYFGTEAHGGGVGDRVFDVYCNGTALLTRFDVFKEAGFGHQLIKTFHGIEPNAQGNVLVSFVPRNNYAMISAIELVDESTE